MLFLFNSVSISNRNKLKEIIPISKFKEFLDILEVYSPPLIYFYVKLIAIVLEKEKFYFADLSNEVIINEIYLESYKKCVAEALGVNVFLNLKNMYKNDILNVEIDKIITIIDLLN